MQLEEPKARKSETTVVKPGTAMLLFAPSLVAMAWLASKAAWYWNHRAELSFGWIVLFLCGYLLWEALQGPMTLKLRFSPSNSAAIIAGALGLFIFQIHETALGLKPAALAGLAAAALLVVFANVHYLLGWEGIRRFAFPFLFLLIALPLPSVVQGIVVNGLQDKVAALAVEILGVFGVPAEKVGSLIHLPNGTVGVDEACSGIRSLQSTVMATLFIGYLSLRGMGLRIVLFVAGIALAILGNIGRVFYLSLVAYKQGVDAVHAAHDEAGWSILLFTVAGVGFLAWALGKAQAASLALDPSPKG